DLAPWWKGNEDEVYVKMGERDPCFISCLRWAASWYDESAGDRLSCTTSVAVYLEFSGCLGIKQLYCAVGGYFGDYEWSSPSRT
ncbi:hypothetical protein A2U01_0063854, partial [Trifolium medium]|nr:hypothetical protein [Trifolium medium]